MQQPDFSIFATFKSRRTLQLIGAMVVAITMSLPAGFWFWSVATNVLLLLSLVGLMYTAWVVRRGHVELGATLSLWILMLLVTALCWLNNGAYDEAVLVYPCILAFAAMIGGARLFFSLLVFILLSIASNIVANIHGWYSNPLPSANYLQLAVITIIFALSGYVMWLWATDMQRLLAHLRVEISNAQLAQAKVKYLLQHDVVTELPNRLSVKEKFGAAVAQAQAIQAYTVLMFIDLDLFQNHQRFAQSMISVMQCCAQWLRVYRTPRAASILLGVKAATSFLSCSRRLPRLRKFPRQHSGLSSRCNSRFVLMVWR